MKERPILLSGRMSAQPEALRIANALNREWHNDALNYDTALAAADELRRLHAENEALREDLRKFREAASCERDLRQEQERHAAALVQQMLEALRNGGSVCASVSTSHDRRIRRDGCTLYAQTEEWCKWAGDEVGPEIIAAITAAREWLGQKGETK